MQWTCFVCGGPVVAWGRLCPGGPLNGRCRNCGMVNTLEFEHDPDRDLDNDDNDDDDDDDE